MSNSTQVTDDQIRTFGNFLVKKGMATREEISEDGKYYDLP
jgi:hypothetical protein